MHGVFNEPASEFNLEIFQIAKLEIFQLAANYMIAKIVLRLPALFINLCLIE